MFTMAYAKDHGIWPRPAPKPAGGQTETTGGGGITPVYPGGGPSGGGGGALGEWPAGTPKPTVGTTGIQSQPSGPPRFTAEGLLKEALIRLWEQARARRAELIDTLTIRLFDAADAFRLLSVVGAIRGADRKIAVFEGEYETSAGSALAIQYRGNPSDAQPLKEFLEPQLRAAEEKTMQARFEIGFGAATGRQRSVQDGRKRTDSTGRRQH